MFDIARFEAQAEEASREAGFSDWAMVKGMAQIGRHDFYDFLMAHREYELARLVWLAPTVYGWD